VPIGSEPEFGQADSLTTVCSRSNSTSDNGAHGVDPAGLMVTAEAVIRGCRENKVAFAAFVAAHIGWGLSQFVVVAFGGVLLTVLYLWNRDLPACMSAHALTDLVGFALARSHSLKVGFINRRSSLDR